jgi:dipeptide transport system permease protein
MLNYLVIRLSILLSTFLGVTLVAFGLIRMIPGDPVLLLLGERGATPQVYETMRHQMGLDLPVPIQYLKFISNAVQGDLGVSTVSNITVLKEFTDRFPATLELGLVALFFATLIGIPLGILAATHRNTFWDYAVMIGSLVGYSMPIFWWGLLLILFFSVQLGLTPVSGRIAIQYDIQQWSGFLLLDCWFSPERFLALKSALSHLILPSIALGTIPLANIARITRSSMLEVLEEDYIRTARAKGLSRTKVIYIHALRNAFIPIVTIIGLLFGTLITGAILTETIFSWPGIGKWLVQSVSARDYPVIQGGILLIATLVIAINLLVDLLYALINPRIRT